MPKALIAPMTLANLDGAFADLLRGAGLRAGHPRCPLQLSEDELLQDLNGVFGALAGSEPYTRRVITANPTLRVIARAGVGYDAVDVEAATEPQRGRRHCAGHEPGCRCRAHVCPDLGPG